MEKLFTRTVVVGCMSSMAAVGSLYAVYGPSVAGFKERFGVDHGAAGIALTVQSSAAILGVLLAPHIARRGGNRVALGSSMLLVLLGTASVALAPTRPLTVTAALVAGVGFGGCDVLITQLLILGGGAKGPALVNLAHGFFGIGTILVSVVVALVGADKYQAAFAVIAAAALPGVLTVRRMAARPTPADKTSTSSGPRATTSHRRLSLWIMGGFVAYT